MTYKNYYDPFDERPNNYMPAFETVEKKQFKIKQHKKQNSPLDFLSRLRADDIILIGVLLLLLFENDEELDISVILGIGFLLITELFG